MRRTDSGIVIFREDTKEYFCGLNTWDKQLRKAKIYHKASWAKDMIDSLVNNTRNPLQRENLNLYNIEIQITNKL